MRTFRSILLTVAVAGSPFAASLAAAGPVTLPVQLDSAFKSAQSGRLLVFATKVEPGAKPSDRIDASDWQPTATAIAAREVDALQPGATATVDGEIDTFPAAFSSLAPGTYRFQAVLDRDHSYNYGGRGGGDIVSPVVEAALPGPVPAMTLSSVLPERTFDTFLANSSADMAARLREGLAHVKPVDFVSPSLSVFWGRNVEMRGWVALPPGYRDGGPRFPTVYATGGYGSNLVSAESSAAMMADMMIKGEAPPMIWVYLDQSTATGTHEFADSANNGPWGKALTAELIPWLEHHYAMDAKPSSRFLTGHSSGGWATLWLQVRYPATFGGSWPTSPDPSDFHNFTNVDLYAAGANAYHDTKGEAVPLVRDHGKVLATLEQFARKEAAIGAYGGQMSSFDWVFSPKGPDGRPLQMFDRTTGAVNPDVLGYWSEHYDIAHIVARDWPKLKHDLDGKIHLHAGTSDTFYLDGSAHRLQAVFQSLGAHEDFTFVPDKTHFDLYTEGDDPRALLKTIAWDMYVRARPGAKRPAG